MKNLLSFLGRRLLFILPQLFGILLVSFFLIKSIPGDPAVLMLGPTATTEAIATLRSKLGLDHSFPVQFWQFLVDLMHGDLGTSWQTTRPVLDDLLQRFPATLELVTFGLLVAILVGVPLGIASAFNEKGWLGRIANIYGMSAGALPDFWLALVFIFVFYTLLHLVPAPLGRLDMTVLPPPQVTGFLTIDSLMASDWGAFRSAVAHLILPVMTLGLINAGPILKMTQSSMERMLRSGSAATKCSPACRGAAGRSSCAAQRPALDHHDHQRTLRLPPWRRGTGRDRVQLGRGGTIRRAGGAELRRLPRPRLRAVLSGVLPLRLSRRGHYLLCHRPPALSLTC